MAKSKAGKPKVKKDKKPKRAIKHGDFDACIRGVHTHRGYPMHTAQAICEKNVGDPKNKKKKK